jgi:hypothetical protein
MDRPISHGVPQVIRPCEVRQGIEEASWILDSQVEKEDGGGEFHDQGDAKWIVIRRLLWGITIHPAGGQSPAGLSAAQGLAARRA